MECSETLEARFWKYVEKTDSCWLWTGSITPRGYGQIASGVNHIPARVHRISWMLHYGPVPKGLFVLHRCDVRRCVRPDHLWIGTAQDNTDDMMKKGRDRHVASHGEAHGRSKLKNSHVIKILEDIDSGMLQKDIAKKFGISQSQVSSIKLGKTQRQISSSYWGKS